MITWLNNKLTDETKAQPLLTSKAFLNGYGVYESLRTHHGKWFKMNNHLERLYESAKLIHLNPKWTQEKVEKQAQEILKECPWAQSRLKIILTEHDVILMAEELKEKPKSWYEKGVKAISFTGERSLPEAKTLGNPLSYVAKREAMKKGAYEAILINPQGYVREGAQSSLFWVKKGQLYTTDIGVFRTCSRSPIRVNWG